MLLAVTARLEVYFLLSAVAGLHRACFYSIPFAVTNDIIQSEVNHSLYSLCIPIKTHLHFNCCSSLLLFFLKQLFGLASNPVRFKRPKGNTRARIIYLRPLVETGRSCPVSRLPGAFLHYYLRLLGRPPPSLIPALHGYTYCFSCFTDPIITAGSGVLFRTQ